jgi:hypothetical protein
MRCRALTPRSSTSSTTQDHRKLDRGRRQRQRYSLACRHHKLRSPCFKRTADKLKALREKARLAAANKSSIDEMLNQREVSPSLCLVIYLAEKTAFLRADAKSNVACFELKMRISSPGT